ACDRLAAAGLLAVAPDIYHGQTYDYSDMDGALAQLRRLDDAAVMNETRTALDWLGNQPAVDGDHLGAMGFCMGGRLAFLAAARHAERLGAAVCFYGGGIAPDGEDRFGRVPPISEAEAIKGSVFLGYGADDQSIDAGQHGRITATLSGLKKRYSLAVYPGAGHGFLCEERPSHAPAAAARAWPEAIDFLHRELADSTPA
ncbi:MAG TPA: dienelactone hydrolase family protein, partial [Gammaproteobacteria bacterium]|nr:dienelactone hydrolase family protein [Gammaproteobacteria bacterium]